MQYNLKDKIEITQEFIDTLISKSWQEAETLQQQIANIDTSTKLGADVAKLLKNTCTNYYVLIGCLETLAENPNVDIIAAKNESEAAPATSKPELPIEPVQEAVDQERHIDEPITPDSNFEPFEYFVDFDEPSGEPLSDTDLYG